VITGSHGSLGRWETSDSACTARAAPRMLKLSLTDGKNNFQALEVEHISALR